MSFSCRTLWWCVKLFFTSLPIPGHIQAIFGGRLSETWYQADGICSYMYGIIQEKLPYSCSKNFRHLMPNAPLPIRIRVRLNPGVTSPMSSPGHQLDATFQVAFARACGARTGETECASTYRLRCTA